MLDCCDGMEDRNIHLRNANINDDVKDEEIDHESMDDEESLVVKSEPIVNENDNKPELAKNATIDSKDGDWYYREDNPDHKLAIITASNPGFQSKMSSISGSYVISKLVEKIQTNYESNTKQKQKFLYQIMYDIKDELHGQGN